MQLTKVYYQGRRSPYLSFFGHVTADSRKLYNTANFMIRNLRSAMYKASRGVMLSEREEECLAVFRRNFRVM